MRDVYKDRHSHLVDCITNFIGVIQNQLQTFIGNENYISIESLYFV